MRVSSAAEKVDSSLVSQSDEFVLPADNGDVLPEHSHGESVRDGFVPATYLQNALASSGGSAKSPAQDAGLKILSTATEKEASARQKLIDNKSRQSALLDMLHLRGDLSPVTAKPEAECRFELVVLRAKGDDIPSKPEWTTSQMGKLNSAAPDVKKAYEQVRHFYDFANGLWDRNAILQTYFPDGFDYCNGQFVVILDYDPDNAEDDIGFPNAFATLGENGESIIVCGRPPKPGSYAAKIIGSVVDDPDVIAHEGTHTYINRMATALLGEVLYSGDAGAVMHESTADAGALAEKYGLLKGAEKFLSGSKQFAIGDTLIIDGALRQMENPGTARVITHPFGADYQKGNYFRINEKEWRTRSRLMNDNGGVHEINSLGNKAIVETTIALGGDAGKAFDIRIGATALACVNGMFAPTYRDFAILSVASAYLLFGEATADIERKSWVSTGIIADTETTADIIKRSGADKIVLKPKSKSAVE